jgi:hypothetical protein
MRVSLAWRTALAAIVVSLAAASLFAPGVVDVSAFVTWASNILDAGVRAGYRLDNNTYPPLQDVLLWISVLATRRLISHDALFWAVKLLIFAAWLASGAVFAWYSRGFMRTVVFAAGLLVSSTALGYTDVLFVPFLVGAYGVLQRNERARRRALLVLFSALFTTAVYIKWQPLIVAPFVLAFFLSRAARRQRLAVEDLGIVAAVALAMTAAIVAIFGTYVLDTLRLSMSDDGLSMLALNFNWIVQHLLHVVKTARYGALSPDPYARIIYGVGGWSFWTCRALFIAHYALALAVFAKRGRSVADLLAASTIGFLSYFTFNIGVHENHLVVPTTLLAVLAAADAAFTTPWIVWTCFANVNVAVFFGVSGLGPRPIAATGGIDLPLAVSIAEVVCFYAIFAPTILRWLTRGVGSRWSDPSPARPSSSAESSPALLRAEARSARSR